MDRFGKAKKKTNKITLKTKNMEAIKKQTEEPVLAVVKDDPAIENVLFSDPEMPEYTVTEENKFSVLSQMMVEKYQLEPELKKLKDRDEHLKKMISLILHYVDIDEYFDIKIGLEASIIKTVQMNFDREKFDSECPGMYEKYKTKEITKEAIKVKTSKGTKAAQYEKNLLKN